MSKAVSLSRKQVERFWRDMAVVNEGREFETDEQRQACKEAVKAMYDFAGAQIRSGIAWNWGLDMPEIDRRIEAAIPSYKSANTDGFSEQMYFFALQATGITDFSQTRLLDVGCGFGQGLNFLSRTTPVGEMVGLDLCQNAINYANARWARPGLAFVCGDAEKMPFGDGEIDAVINIESSHTYPDFGRFLSEVRRVLRPGGIFSFVDVFTEERCQRFDAMKAGSGFQWRQQTDITAQVKSAIVKRLQPDSFLRTTLKGQGGSKFGLHNLTEPLLLVNYGADFVDFRFSLAQRIFRSAVTRLLLRSMSAPEIKLTSYVHHLAVKT
ncbi:class I SAM-dependent methyltransferase [Tahibacter amnicola]|uniref:Class I SAM-dependent methyltransferase n=1 Tax=Tahibacter amnicola TaxID=2976241 RepID=A0ABY6BBC6_9GAMM|nr:class I SAM-dependent methyltransferase [Tahibacter amnicola]UXI65936.1 class I SAM-dependent methyltransferase [Tahibacter amnicola]